MTAPTGEPVGRPSSFNQQVADRITELVALGFMWRQIVKRTGVNFRKVMRWRRRFPEFDMAVSRARAEAAHVTVEQMRDIELRMCLPRTLPTGERDKKGKLVMELNPDWIDPHAGGMVIRSMMWRASKANHEAYGDRREMHVSGEIIHKPVKADAPDWVRNRLKPPQDVVVIDHQPAEPTKVDEPSG